MSKKPQYYLYIKKCKNEYIVYVRDESYYDILTETFDLKMYFTLENVTAITLYEDADFVSNDMANHLKMSSTKNKLVNHKDVNPDKLIESGYKSIKIESFIYDYLKN